jgi:hypothetical protein
MVIPGLNHKTTNVREFEMKTFWVDRSEIPVQIGVEPGFPVNPNTEL